MALGDAMKFLFSEPKEPPPGPAAAVERWYSRPERSWVVRMVDALGNQIGEATYVHGKAEALAEERRMKGELS
jgi:hypothetical protein